MDKISPEHSLSRLKPQSFLILPLYFRCSKTLIPLVSLCWSYSSSSFFLLYWATQCSKCVSFTIFFTTTDTPKTKNHFYFSEYPGSKVDNATEILFCVSKSPQYILIPYSAVSWGSNPVLNQFWWSSAEFLNVRSKQKILKGKKKSIFISPFCNIFLYNSSSERYWSFPILHPFFFLWSTSQHSTIFSTLISIACQKHNWWFHQCYWHSCCRKRISKLVFPDNLASSAVM